MPLIFPELPGVAFVNILVEEGDPDYPLVQFLLEQLNGKMAPVAQEATPSSGDTVVMTTPKMSGLLTIKGSIDLASLTIELPPDTETKLMQTRMIVSEVSIASLTVSLTGTTIHGAPDSISPEDPVTFQKVASNIWIRIV